MCTNNCPFFSSTIDNGFKVLVFVTYAHYTINMQKVLVVLLLPAFLLKTGQWWQTQIHTRAKKIFLLRFASFIRFFYRFVHNTNEIFADSAISHSHIPLSFRNIYCQCFISFLHRPLLLHYQEGKCNKAHRL